MARQLLQQHQFFAAHYFTGIAAEAMLRSLSTGDDDFFDGTHSIEHWARKVNILPSGSDTRQYEIRVTLDEINTRWRGNQRYYTGKMLDSYLEATGLDNIRGDRVKYSSKRLFDLVTFVVGLGVQKWKSSR